ncbi:unnamed protein product [Tilletia caries]|uniref:Uncharacterized protein n=1 Tax=Tilletia caries TaxID=13290 RepID=A0A177VBT7_9BASI|nr:hypothetical protein CF335_g7084 [Tilletia laevis]KAE8247518.1 hypothetical protein A4X03_0g7027 [Tilletia caries]CAD6885056.1 unnamed protein product [Tilletia caries]
MPVIPPDDLDESILRFAVHARELTGIPLRPHQPSWPPQLAHPPSPLAFARILSAHTPLIINNALQDRNRLWNEWSSNEYLTRRMGTEQTFAVALTPNGRADDLVSKDEGEGENVVFALPHEQQMNFPQLLDALHQTSTSAPIAYLQSQNSNLTTLADEDKGGAGPFRPLLDDLLHSSSPSSPKSKPYPEWAAEAIGKEPEATNIWIGTSKSRSSMHRDHYENLFLVVRGTKTFTVLPPTEGHFLSAEDTFYPLCQWTPDHSLSSSSESRPPLKLEPLPNLPPTPWIPIDPLPPSPSNTRPPAPPQAQTRYTKFLTRLSPLPIQVHAGQMLYLPAGWYHAVEQVEDIDDSPPEHDGGGRPGICLGVNWWWEADVGDRWAWLGLVRELNRRAKGVFEQDEEMV